MDMDRVSFGAASDALGAITCGSPGALVQLANKLVCVGVSISPK